MALGDHSLGQRDLNLWYSGRSKSVALGEYSLGQGNLNLGLKKN